MFSHNFSAKERALYLCKEMEKSGFSNPIRSSSVEDESEHIELYTKELHSVVEIMGESLSASVYMRETHKLISDIDIEFNVGHCIDFLKAQYNAIHR